MLMALSVASYAANHWIFIRGDFPYGDLDFGESQTTLYMDASLSSEAPPDTDIPYTLSDNASWLSISPISDVALRRDEVHGGLPTNTHRVDADRAGLSPGTYYAQIHCTDSQSTINVTMVVGEEDNPSLCKDTAMIDFGCSSTSDAFELWNCETGTLTYSISDSEPWLSVSPTSGSSGGGHNTHQVTVDRSTLSPGTHSATITIDPNEGINQTIAVSVCVEDGPTHTLTITTHGEGTTSPSAGVHTYEEGAVVRVEADADPGWEFDHWSGASSSTSDSVNVTMSGDKTLAATFVEAASAPADDPEDDGYSITLFCSGEGTIHDEWGARVYPGRRIGGLAYGERRTFTAEASDGWDFDEWRGQANGDRETLTVTVTTNHRITVVFSASESGASSSGEADSSDEESGDQSSDPSPTESDASTRDFAIIGPYLTSSACGENPRAVMEWAVQGTTLLSYPSWEWTLLDPSGSRVGGSGIGQERLPSGFICGKAEFNCLSPGVYTFSLRAWDTACGYAERSVQFFVDLNAECVPPIAACSLRLHENDLPALEASEKTAYASPLEIEFVSIPIVDLNYFMDSLRDTTSNPVSECSIPADLTCSEGADSPVRLRVSVDGRLEIRSGAINNGIWPIEVDCKATLTSDLALPSYAHSSITLPSPSASADVHAPVSSPVSYEAQNTRRLGIETLCEYSLDAYNGTAVVRDVVEVCEAVKPGGNIDSYTYHNCEEKEIEIEVRTLDATTDFSYAWETDLAPQDPQFLKMMSELVFGLKLDLVVTQGESPASTWGEAISFGSDYVDCVEAFTKATGASLPALSKAALPIAVASSAAELLLGSYGGAWVQATMQLTNVTIERMP